MINGRVPADLEAVSGSAGGPTDKGEPSWLIAGFGGAPWPEARRKVNADDTLNNVELVVVSFIPLTVKHITPRSTHINPDKPQRHKADTRGVFFGFFFSCR